MSDGWRAPGVASRPTQSQRRSCTEGQGAPQMPPTPRSPVMHEDCRDDDALSIVLSRPLTPEPVAIYVSFFLSQFTPNPPRALLPMIQNCRRYLGQLLDRPSPGGTESNMVCPHPAMDGAEALVMTYFGKQHGSDLLIRESIRSYARALKSFSLKLDEVQSIGLASVEEDEWIHLVFSCVFLTLWEVSGKPATCRSWQMVCHRANMKGKLAMHPTGTAWQKHVRGLASVIEGRGPQGFRSPRSLELVALLRLLIVSTAIPLIERRELSHRQLRQLLESISSKRRTFLSREEWRAFRGSRPGSAASAAKHIIQSAEVVGPKHYLDYLIGELVTISNLTADFAGLCDGDGATDGQNPRCLVSTQSALSESLEILQRLETVLAHTLPSDKANLLGQPLKHNLTSLCRTGAMTLRSLMCNLINQQGGVDRDRLLQLHRAALMVHAEAVLDAIPYSSRSDVFDAAPMCFVPAFRMAEAVLVKESNALQTEPGRESELARCNSMKQLVRCHLDFVASKKIPVKIDV